jgi:glyoxylase-like metal-dependent hydrolase (beta-lactamase superfamily II)
LIERIPMLVELTERVSFAPGGVNIGVILADDESAILVDTGLNDTSVRKVLRELDGAGRRVTDIITTHGHADHFGGNAFAVKRTGARVHAPRWDETILRYPLFQPLSLFAGADPPASMRTGFLLAAESPVDVIYDAGPMTVAGVDLEAVSLAGHSGNQMGILVDGVFFCADVILPERVIERYKMPYLYSVRDHLPSLDRAESVEHAVAVPGHGPTLEHVSVGVAPNRLLVIQVAEMVAELCTVPRSPEDVLALVLERLSADPTDAPGYYLLHPTVFAYLTYLESEGVLEHHIERGRSLWQRR